MDDAVTLRQWTNLVRRARLGSHTTAVALTLATYADADGSRVYPGIARLSYDIELSYTTVRRALAKLRESGLIRKVGRHGDADAYRLIFADDVMERVDVPTPAQVDAHLETVRKHKRGTYVSSLRLSSGAADIPEDEYLPPSTGAADEKSAAHLESRTEESAALSDTLCGSPRRAATVQDRDTKTTIHADNDLRTAVTVTRASDDTSRPNRCKHGNNARPKKGTTIPRCEHCRAETQPAGTDETMPPAAMPEEGAQGAHEGADSAHPGRTVRPVEPLPVPVITGPGRYAKTKCAEHGLPVANCILCRKGLPGKAAA